jgi:ferric-dicitrate binding protein FerR (iron transport regulator)
MNSDPELEERLLRWIDGRSGPDETCRVETLLRDDQGARDRLRSLAETAVLVGDLGRAGAWRAAAGSADPGPTTVGLRGGARGWLWPAAAVVLAGSLAAMTTLWLGGRRTAVARIVRATGASGFFDARGRSAPVGEPGWKIGSGDLLATSSGDAWIEMELRDGARITLAGFSGLRVYEDEGQMRFLLERGSLWFSPSLRNRQETLRIQTPFLEVAASSAQFDLQASAAGSLARVNSGSVLVSRLQETAAVAVDAGRQVSVDLDHPGPLDVQPQPRPITRWAARLDLAPEPILGRWLASDRPGRMRLRAVPFLVPTEAKAPILIFAVSLTPQRNSDRPVQLRRASTLVFRGRLEHPVPVRFGVTTQRMQGVFSGRFEIEIPPSELKEFDGHWEVVLPLERFLPTPPQLYPDLDGLELTDVYALTCDEDAGLELNDVELRPAPGDVGD